MADSELRRALAERDRRERERLRRRVRTHEPPTRWTACQVPPCFDSIGDWLTWRELTALSHAALALPCVDCTREYQREMRSAGRCANPQLAVHG